MNAIERQITYTQASGWILESGFKQSLLANSEFTASQAEALYTRIEDMVSLLKGSKPGLIEKNIVSETIKISGDTTLTVQVMKVYHVQHITIRVYCNNKYVPVTIPVLTHISIHISFQTSVGADHSGGGLS